jgi:hypothetical protein
MATTLEINNGANAVSASQALPVTAQPAAPAHGPSGTWPIVPNVLWFGWNVDETNQRANVQVMVLGVQVDTLSGVLDIKGPTLSFTDNLNLTIPMINFDILSADVTITIDATGLLFDGDIGVHGKDLASLKEYVLRW